MVKLNRILKKKKLSVSVSTLDPSKNNNHVYKRKNFQRNYLLDLLKNPLKFLVLHHPEDSPCGKKY